MQARYLGLDPAPLQKLFGLPDELLARQGAIRIVAGSKPGFPCRISLRDAEPGEPVLLLTHQHLAGDTPYRSSGPIFVREGAGEAYAGTDLPPDMTSRLYSIRAYDHAGMMIDAEIAEGEARAEIIQRYLARDEVAFLHLHHARRGCFACRVERG